jgi:two-component system nitrate/nitrite response regulator NarL
MDKITPREREIMIAVLEGLSNKLICRKLGISEGTVKIHLHNIYEKLGIANRTMLAVLALKLHGDQPEPRLPRAR